MLLFNSTVLADAAYALDALTDTGNSLYGTVNFANYSYFDPTSWSPNDAPGSDPQRFLVYTPGISTHVIPGSGAVEPSSLMLLGNWRVLVSLSVARCRIVKA